MEKGLEAPEEGALLGLIEKEFKLSPQDPNQLSPLTLAYIGDAIYDMIIRTVIVEQGNAPVSRLHKRTSALVKAPSQAELIYALLPELSEEEERIYKRGRNAKSFTSAKNSSIVDYRTATGLEALVGYLYLTGRSGRAVELVREGLERLKQGQPGPKSGGEDRV